MGDAVPGLHESTLFLQNPTILAISTYRAHPETGVINHTPVTTEENLDISDLSINYNKIKSCQYRLFATINYHGMSYNSGHYTATLFDRDRAVTFNHKRIDQREGKNAQRCYVHKKYLHIILCQRDRHSCVSKFLPSFMATF